MRFASITPGKRHCNYLRVVEDGIIAPMDVEVHQPDYSELFDKQPKPKELPLSRKERRQLSRGCGYKRWNTETNWLH